MTTEKQVVIDEIESLLWSIKNMVGPIKWPEECDYQDVEYRRESISARVDSIKDLLLKL